MNPSTAEKGKALYNSGHFTDVLHGVFEENEGHDSVQFVVFSEGQVTHLGELLSVLELSVELVIEGLSELEPKTEVNVK